MFCFLRVIEYLLRNGNISKSSQYLCSACDSHVKTVLEKKKNLVKEVAEKNDNSKEEQIPDTDI